MISVIIPTYKEPEYLDLCLKSAIEGQVNKNQIIVVVDGFYEENKHILNKWKDNIQVLDLEQNCGLPYATNIGVYNAIHDWILVVNDDNVFIKRWDEKLNKLDKTNVIYSLNQVEPNPSIFPQFIIKNYGKTADTFNLEQFWKDFENNPSFLSTTGGTLPFFVSKKCYLMVGGWDEHYPTNGVVADWDFFYKCEQANIDLIRDHETVFYHFAQIATGNQRQVTEQEGHNYFYYKWNTSYIPKALRK
jgi:glycosyltransferase involved in cell wall biosynthesis